MSTGNVILTTFAKATALFCKAKADVSGLKFGGMNKKMNEIIVFFLLEFPFSFN